MVVWFLKIEKQEIYKQGHRKLWSLKTDYNVIQFNSRRRSSGEYKMVTYTVGSQEILSTGDGSRNND